MIPLDALIPIFIYFLIGVVLRRTGLAGHEHAAFVFRLVFYVTLPALAFGVISEKSLNVATASLPVAGFVVNLVCTSTALVYLRIKSLPPPTAGAVILGASITNTVFMFPFVLAVLGSSALADAVLYDVGNAVFVATVAYALAARYGNPGKSSIAASLARILRSPLFIAIFSAILFSVAGWEVPASLRNVVEPLGATTPPLILIALGTLFTTSRFGDPVVYTTILIRMAGGFVTGLVLVSVLNLQGVTALAVVACAAAPTGFNAVTLSTIDKLDVEHAAASVALSVALGLLSATAILVIGSRWI